MASQRLTFLGLDSFWWGALLFGCFVLAVAIVVSIYRYERRLVSRPVGYGLLGLRIAVLATLLLMALQPTFTWTTVRQDQNRILIALDVSESMDLVDRQADANERRHWAESLGMIQSSESDSPTSDDDGVPQIPAQSSQPEAKTNLSRFELARQLLLAPERGLLERLQQVAQLEFTIFSASTTPTTAEELTGSRSELAINLRPGVTSYKELLTEAASRDDLTAVLLLTDGVETGDEGSIEAASQLGGMNRPVYSLLAGSLNQPVDLAMESIDHPESVYKGDQPLIRVRASTHGFENTPLTLTLTDIVSGNRMTRNVIGGERFVDAEFEMPLNEAGRRRFILEIQPSEVGGKRDELQTDNNRQEFAINVVDDTARVMIVDGEARWEFRFLESAYHRDERVDLNAILFQQPYLGLLPRTFFAANLPAGNQQRETLEDLDLLVWGDADPRNVDQSTWEQLERFVADGGGTLVVSAGRRYYSTALQHPVLGRMLPVDHVRPIDRDDEDPKLSPRERGFHLQLTPQGKQHPLMKLQTETEDNAAAWEQLPGHLWGLEGTPKSGAVTLAVPLGVNAGGTSRRPVGSVIVQNYGLGRVVWLGIDSTWRWRARSGDRDHYRFWGQMSRWAAEMRSSAGSDDVRFALDATEVQVGEQTTVRARWSPKLAQNSGEIDAFVEVYPADAEQDVPLLSFPLSPVETEPRLHEGMVPQLPPGEYKLELKARDLPLGSQEISTDLFVTARQNSENTRLAASRTRLDQLAAVSDGAVYRPHEIDLLLERLDPDWRSLIEKQDIPLWSHWFLFVIIMGLLGAEWMTRKWHGLP